MITSSQISAYIMQMEHLKMLVLMYENPETNIYKKLTKQEKIKLKQEIETTLIQIFGRQNFE